MTVLPIVDRRLYRMKRGIRAVVFTALAAAVPHAAAQKAPRIGFLSVAEPELSLDPFREGLKQHGYVEGRNISIEVHFATLQPGRLPQLAALLAGSGVDIIVAGGSDSIRAAQRATKTIPIVMAQTSDALGSGFVGNLARPGGNITGVSSQGTALGAKRVQLVKELVPKAVRVAVLVNPANPSHRTAFTVLEQAAQSLTLQLTSAEVRDARDLDGAFRSLAKLNADALLILPDNMLFNEREHIVRLATQARLPSVHWRKEWVEAGGLVSYGQDNPAMYRLAASYVDKIFKGAKPGELAVEQPSKVEVFVNLKTAKALGVAVPRSLLLQADRVIE